MHTEKTLATSRCVVRRQQSSSVSLLTLTLAQHATHTSAYRHIDRQSVSVREQKRKSVRLKNAPLPHDGRRTQANRWRHTSVCARFSTSRRAVKHVRARARARFLRTHGHLSPLIASHKNALAIRVMTRARHEPEHHPFESRYFLSTFFFYLKFWRLN